MRSYAHIKNVVIAKQTTCHLLARQDLPEDLITLSKHACFGGAVSFHEHRSESCDAAMRFALLAVITGAYGNTSSSLFDAKRERYIDDVLISPITPFQMALAYVLGGALRGLLVGAGTYALATWAPPGAPRSPTAGTSCTTSRSSCWRGFCSGRGRLCARRPHRRRRPKTKATGPSFPGPSCPTGRGITTQRWRRPRGSAYWSPWGPAMGEDYPPLVPR